MPLKVIGTGSDRQRLQKLAGKYTELVGKVSDVDLRYYFRNARAIIQPGVEDFGMTSVEALACGTPIIAYDQGGVQEIITSSKLGILYKRFGEEHLAEAMRQFLEREHTFIPALLQQQALKFSKYRWQMQMQDIVEQTWAKWHSTNV